MNKAIENRRASAKFSSSQRMAQHSTAAAAAPLWRNAPTSADYNLQQRSHHSHPQSISSSAVLAETLAFHRSLRNYPPPPGFKFVESNKKNSPEVSQKPISRIRTSPSVDSFALPSKKERCHITNLDAEQSTPFYLDYLDTTTGESANSKVFNHRSFIEMFRPPPASATPLDANQQQSSLSYSVNEFQDSLKTSKKAFGTKLKHSSSFTNSFLRNSNNNKMNTDNKANLAFGRTKGRDIDLNAPLKTFTSPARPISEIITANINFSPLDSNSLGNEITHRGQSNYGACEDSYTSNRRNYRHSIAEVIGGSNLTQYHPRVGRRHDPELMPAQIKYTFREYAAPSAYRHSNQPGSMTTSQSNFLMTSSSAGVSLQRTFAGGAPNRGMPKKSISMSRLDQLAQPRRRIVPRPAGPPTPTEQQAHSPRTFSARNAQASSTFLRKKPEVPARRSQTAAAVPLASPLTAKPKPDVASKRTVTPSQKPRPKSQIEPLESLASNHSQQQQQQQQSIGVDSVIENVEAKPSDDYKKLMAERRAAFQKQKLEEERKRQEEMEKKRKEEEEERKRLENEENERQREAAALEEEEIKRIVAEKQEKEFSQTESEFSSNENPFVHNLEDAKQENELIEKNSEISREGELFLVTGEVPKPVDPLVNVGMTQSFDVSILSSERAKNDRLAKEKLEEHQAALLRQEELERQKRKNRVAELLKGRTRKNGDGGKSPSGSGPSTPAQQTDNEAASMAAEQSTDAEHLAQKLNGIVVTESVSVIAQQSVSTNGATGGELNGHQQDVIKQFAAENEQSLPPTNGF